MKKEETLAEIKKYDAKAVEEAAARVAKDLGIPRFSEAMLNQPALATKLLVSCRYGDKLVRQKQRQKTEEESLLLALKHLAFCAKAIGAIDFIVLAKQAWAEPVAKPGRKSRGTNDGKHE